MSKWQRSTPSPGTRANSALAARALTPRPRSFLQEVRAELLSAGQFHAALGGLKAAAANEKFSAVRVAALDAVVKWLQRPDGQLCCARASSAHS